MILINGTVAKSGEMIAIPPRMMNITPRITNQVRALPALASTIIVLVPLPTTATAKRGTSRKAHASDRCCDGERPSAVVIACDKAQALRSERE